MPKRSGGSKFDELKQAIDRQNVLLERLIENDDRKTEAFEKLTDYLMSKKSD